MVQVTKKIRIISHLFLIKVPLIYILTEESEKSENNPVTVEIPENCSENESINESDILLI